MSFLSNALIGNPFSTPVGGRIEQATDASMASENWARNMEICDLVNETEDGPRDAVKAIRKRLSQNAGKNYTVVMYTLTILETCVKNCGKRFHVLICAKDFVQDLVKLIGPKNDPPTAVQEKVLSLIQAWAGAFRDQPETSGVVSIYQDLLAKGIEFPATDLDSLAPILTPKKSVHAEPAVEARAPDGSAPAPAPAAVAPSPGASLTAEQRAKMQSELDVVQSNMSVLNEMLNEIKPGEELPDELELLQELEHVCRAMQHRLVELIGRLPNDGLFEELLRINDDLNNLFLRYGRWEKNRGARRSASAVLASAVSAPPAASASLIDFGEELPARIDKLVLSPTAVAPSGQTVSSTTSDRKPDEFDMFAESRKATYESSKKSGSTYEDNLNPDQASETLSSFTQGKRHKNPEDREFDEMANWLGSTPGPEESVSSSDFERFLAERAAAAEHLPRISSTNASPATAQAKNDKDKLLTQ